MRRCVGEKPLRSRRERGFILGPLHPESTLCCGLGRALAWPASGSPCGNGNPSLWRSATAFHFTAADWPALPSLTLHVRWLLWRCIKLFVIRLDAKAEEDSDNQPLPKPWNCMKVKVKLLSHVRLFVTPWTVAYQAVLSMAFSRQEYWSGLPFPSPGDLPNPGIEPGSPAL